MIDGTLPLCENEFDIEDAMVICRQLNMSFVSYLTRNSKFGNTTHSSGMSLSCIGTESAISECIRKENVDCGIRHGAGVSCSNVTRGEKNWKRGSCGLKYFDFSQHYKSTRRI